MPTLTRGRIRRSPAATAQVSSGLGALADSDRIEGPFVVVRRIADSSDPTVVSSLHRALDGHIGGTVELADEGPLSVEDFRVAGETRLIRARTGFARSSGSIGRDRRLCGDKRR